MFANYVTSAIRALMKDQFHAALNIAGLAVSLAAAMLIAVYVLHELSYDDFFTDPGQVYRIEATRQNGGSPSESTAGTPYLLMPRLNADFPEQLEATQFSWQSVVIRAGDHLERQLVVVAADNLFDVLDFPVAHGDAAAALRQPGKIVLSEQMAKHFFGTEEAIGQHLTINGETDLEVGAVLKDLPSTSHFTDFGLLVNEDVPFYELSDVLKNNWNTISQHTLIRLRKGISAKDMEAQLPAFVERQVPPEMVRRAQLAFSMRPLQSIHLDAGDDSFHPTNRNAVTAVALTGMAFALVLIACFNYVNLATARAILRRPEVGLRKILGGTTGQLALQFMGETFVMTLLAFALALTLAMLFLPVFSSLLGRDLTFSAFAGPEFFAVAMGLYVFVNLAAGLYPAVILARSRPIALFNKQKTGAGSRHPLRSVLVALQFSLTVGLVVAASVVFAQVRYLENFDLGFDKDGMLLVRNDATDVRGGTFIEELSQSPYFLGVTGSNAAPEEAYALNNMLSRPDDPAIGNRSLTALYVKENFFTVYGMSIVAGRAFTPDFGGDVMRQPTKAQPVTRAAAVLSQSAVSYLGFASAEDAIGKQVEMASPRGDNLHSELTVIGIVPDLQFELGHGTLKPMIYYYAPDRLWRLSARVRPGDAAAALADAKRIWSGIFPETPFDYEFLQDRITAANADDARQSQLFAFFTGLAIIIACLGLSGLASFVAARRTREVAIRKVLGASTGRITRLLLWDFAKPVLLANLIAWPIAWILMRHWLDGFPYRIALSPAFFLGASALALAVALLTVFARTWRAARIRPATALKYE
jgi:putative ABC transport system permease protein